MRAIRRTAALIENFVQRVLVVGVDRGNVNQAPYTTCKGRLHDVACAHDIRAMELLRPDGIDRDQRGQMKHDLCALEGGDQRILVQDVAIDPCDIQVRRRAPALPVERADPTASVPVGQGPRKDSADPPARPRESPARCEVVRLQMISLRKAQFANRRPDQTLEERAWRTQTRISCRCSASLNSSLLLGDCEGNGSIGNRL